MGLFDNRRAGRDSGPVEEIEVSGGHMKLRLAAFLIMLAIGIFFLCNAFFGLLNRDPGWREVTVRSDAGANCGSELELWYLFEGGNATAVYKQLTALYTDAAVRADALFSAVRPVNGVANVQSINAGKNGDVRVEPELYAALELILSSGSRALYLAPVWAEYEQIFRCSYDYEAAAFDPFKSDEQRAYIDELLRFVSDDAHVSLALLGDDTVRLTVSEEYLRFAEEYGIETFIDFYWMKNAFIVDYIAGQLAENGYTRGYVSSHDGFMRNLDAGGEKFTITLYDRQGTAARKAAVMSCDRPIAAVYLRDYPASDSIADYYYRYEDGEIRTPFVDMADGLCRSAVSDLLAYSETMSCARILLSAAPLYIADSLSAEQIRGLDFYALWCEGDEVLYTEKGVQLSDLYRNETVSYRAVYAGD